ncbi:MAG: Rrf2 family transcriptional regulator [Candidatus Eisenbacteria bacterium]
MASDKMVLNAGDAAEFQSCSLGQEHGSVPLETLRQRPLPRSDPRKGITHISDSTRLGIALLLSLADAGTGRVTIEALVDATCATYATVARILRRLAQAKLVRSTRGPGGGWRLSVPPSCIALRQVIKALRADDASPKGSTAGERSILRGSTLLDSVIWRGEAPLVRALAGVSLADMLDTERQAGNR